MDKNMTDQEFAEELAQELSRGRKRDWTIVDYRRQARSIITFFEKAGYLSPEEYQAKIEEMIREIDFKMQLEQCDPQVMIYYPDYYWVSQEEWVQAFKEKYGVK